MTLPAEALAGLLPPEPEPAQAPPAEPTTWRARLWVVPAETRLTLPEAAEALGRSRSWVYKRTGPKSVEKIPCRRLAGELVFHAGELRAWVARNEEIIHAGPSLRAVR